MRKGQCPSWLSSVFTFPGVMDVSNVDMFAPGDLLKLPFWEACLKEAMRLYQPGIGYSSASLCKPFKGLLAC